MIGVGTAIGRGRMLVADDDGGDWRLTPGSSPVGIDCETTASLPEVAEVRVLASEVFEVLTAGTEGNAFRMESLSKLFSVAADSGV